jgi:hypothetical protein
MGDIAAGGVIVCTVVDNSTWSRFGDLGVGDLGGVCPGGGKRFDGEENGSPGMRDSMSSTPERFGTGGDSGVAWVDGGRGLWALSLVGVSTLGMKFVGKELSTVSELALPRVWLGPGGETGVLTWVGLDGLSGDETIDFGLISPLEAWGKTLGRFVADLARW